MEIVAPQDKQRGTARVNWLLRQLKSADGEHVLVRIVWPSRAPDTICRLAELRDDPKAIVGNATQAPKSFEVFLLSGDGRRFSGRKTFIDEVEHLVPLFYDQIGQNLERWLPKPPKPVAKTEVTGEGAAPQEKEQAESAEPGQSVSPNKITPGNLHSDLIEIPPFMKKTIAGDGTE